jgi:hypothetical protein
MVKAEIILDSINSKTDDRLTTWVLTYPRFIHSELMTHRMLSKNSASSRAIPSKKIIEMVVTEPAMPEFWGKNQSGMQAIEELSPLITGYEGVATIPDISPRGQAKRIWLEARDSAVKYTEQLIKIGLHKQIANRLLEPWFNITILCSGTEWENFFALRAHKDAQPEFRVLAEMMLEEYNKNIPIIRKPNGSLTKFKPLNVDIASIEQDWHIPFGDKMPKGLSKLDQLKVAIARGARLSYLTFDGEADIEKDFSIYDKLLDSQPLHTSPAEHPAFPISESKFVGNYRGWYQYRKLLPYENAKDSRIFKRQVVDGKVI